MDVLTNPVRRYAWGSRTGIATVTGRPAPTAEPEAELWMGAHPAAPSTTVRYGVRRTLPELIAADPDAELGRPVHRDHGARLPFLFKLLAADAPLSIQVHPDQAQARTGFDREEAAFIRRDDPRRSYPDPYHKPELVCAVSEFDTLCGFRDATESAELLAGLGLPALRAAAERLATEPDGLRSVFVTLVTLSPPERLRLVDDVVSACARRQHGPHGAAYALTAELGGQYPGDIGAVVALLMNPLRLLPGEALYMPAGKPHSYLRGLAVEVMASSDNVLRCGLTPKHVDVPELLRVIRFEQALAEPAAPAIRAGQWVWTPPVREFQLARAVLPEIGGATSWPAGGPAVLFCLSGRISADDGLGTITLSGGESAFVQAGRPLTVAGHGTVFHATTAG